MAQFTERPLVPKSLSGAQALRTDDALGVLFELTKCVRAARRTSIQSIYTVLTEARGNPQRLADVWLLCQEQLRFHSLGSDTMSLTNGIDAALQKTMAGLAAVSPKTDKERLKAAIRSQDVRINEDKAYVANVVYMAVLAAYALARMGPVAWAQASPPVGVLHILYGTLDMARTALSNLDTIALAEDDATAAPLADVQYVMNEGAPAAITAAFVAFLDGGYEPNTVDVRRTLVQWIIGHKQMTAAELIERVPSLTDQDRVLTPMPAAHRASLLTKPITGGPPAKPIADDEGRDSEATVSEEEEDDMDLGRRMPSDTVA